MGTLLDGIRVLDLSPYLPGPYTSRLLADLGADVIKIEAPRGDPIRTFMPGVYEFLNRGKRVVRADLKKPSGRTFVLELIASADVVIEAFRPGVVERLGLGYVDAVERRPGIVYCSISSHGQDGPARDRVGHNLGFEAAGGAYAPALAAGDEPAPAPIALADVGGASIAATTVCAALAGRELGNLHGPLHLDVSLEEIVTYLALPRWGRYLRDGEAHPDEIANRGPGVGLFATLDGRWLATAAVEDHLWKAMCQWLDLPELTTPPYDTHAGRMADRTRLSAMLRDRIRARTATELLTAAESRDVPVELARTYGEVVEDPHLRARAFIRDGAEGTVADYPVRVGDARSAAPDRAPEPVADLASVVAELRLSGNKLAALADGLPDLASLAVENTR